MEKRKISAKMDVKRALRAGRMGGLSMQRVLAFEQATNSSCRIQVLTQELGLRIIGQTLIFLAHSN
jgi:hypothetical protein